MTAIVPAAGCGARTGLSGNKILAPLCGQPLLCWTLQALADSIPQLCGLGLELKQILIAARREEFEILNTLPPLAFRFPCAVALVEGGATRQESVGNAARVAQTDFLLVHDAARPLLTPGAVARVAQAALQSGAAVAALTASDTVKIARLQNKVPVVKETVERQTVWLAQTPQIFRRELYLKALEAAQRENFDGTDCASLVERTGVDVVLVEGETENLKVTFATDLERAEAILKARQNAVN